MREELARPIGRLAKGAEVVDAVRGARPLVPGGDYPTADPVARGVLAAHAGRAGGCDSLRALREAPDRAGELLAHRLGEDEVPAEELSELGGRTSRWH